jgi:hypothetical protein
MEDIKIYKPLVMPEDSAWDRFTIRRYIPNWILKIETGLSNLISWLPVIWKDRNWDDFYILEITKQKLLRQRKYLIEHNRHMGIWQVNRDITICLNLIERIQNDYYACEYQDYCKQELVTSPSDKEGWLLLDIETTEQNFEPFVKKYRNTYARVVKGEYMKRRPDSIEATVHFMAHLNQERCNKLLFKILAERQSHWWD